MAVTAHTDVVRSVPHPVQSFFIHLVLEGEYPHEPLDPLTIAKTLLQKGQCLAESGWP